MPHTLTAAVALTALASLAYALYDLRCVLAVRHLARQPAELPPALDCWPGLTMVVPSRDEASTLGPALRSRLADDYPALEVVVIDDRSTDGTGEVARHVAAHDERVRVARVEELPAGWLGKVNAMARGTALATGEWLLFSDADIHAEPGTLRRAVAYAERQRLDFLSVYPELVPADFALDAVLAVLTRVLSRVAPAHRVADDRTQTGMAAGAFSLVRRSAFERTEGFEWLRMEAAEDVGLGVLMKLSGSRCELLCGRGSLRVLFYPSLRAMWRGMEKNVAIEGIRGIGLYAGFVGLLAVVELSPFTALAVAAATRSPLLAGLGLAAGIATTVSTAAHLYAGNGTMAPALAWPLGSLLFFAGMLRAGWLSFRRGGVQWRGTLYANDDLHAGMRVMSWRARRELREATRRREGAAGASSAAAQADDLGEELEAS